MIRLAGTNRRLCDGISRRDFIQIGALSSLGLSVSDLLASSASGSAKAKSCILLFLYGSPPQHETFDPKPDAPREIQGEMGCIPTTLPGVRFCEGLPRVAKITDDLTVVRSMSHPYPVHGVAYAVSGIPTYDPSL